MESPGQAPLIIVRPDRIGDVVISSSCFVPVRAALPNAKIYFAAQARMTPLFQGHPLLAGFIPLPDSGDDATRIEKLTAQFRAVKAGTIVHLQSDPVAERAAVAAGIPRRLGYQQKKQGLLTEFLPEPKKRLKQHEAQFNFDLLQLLGVSASPPFLPNLHPDPAASARLQQKLPAAAKGRRYAVLHLGAHGEKPRIAVEFFIAVANWLINAQKLQVFLIGVEQGSEAIAAIRQGVRDQADSIHDLCGATDLAEAAILLRDAAIVFGRDSGPAHLAAAMGAHTVTLMLEPEPENSALRWQPLGPHSWVLEKPLKRGWLESRPAFARRNLRQYTPEEIIAALEDCCRH